VGGRDVTASDVTASDVTASERVLDGHLPGSGPWMLAMRWTDLLFAHWRIDPDATRRLIPEPLEPDLFDGSGWLGLVPFRMSHVRPRLLPPVPPISAFPEVNVRTYARYGGRPGVWFLSLDAAGRVAVRLGRGGAGLPYHHAAMVMTTTVDGWIDYRSVRTAPDPVPAALAMRYRPIGRVRPPSELETFLTHRDGLWTLGADGSPSWLAIRHGPWPLQDAEATLREETLTAAGRGPAFDREPDHLAFSRRVDVVAWRPRRIAGPG
jgi:uncharacterized protein